MLQLCVASVAWMTGPGGRCNEAPALTPPVSVGALVRRSRRGSGHTELRPQRTRTAGAQPSGGTSGMTLRRRLRTIVLSTALITGGLAAVPLATGAASAAAPAPAMRNDPMAPIAAQALDSLVEYASTGDMESRK